MRAFRKLCGILTLTSVLACIAAPVFATDWSHAYKLTPLEHKRLRAKGLSDKEVYAVANVTNWSGRHVDDVVQRLMMGGLTELDARGLGADPGLLHRRLPEWGTPAWEEAVKRGDYFFIVPR